MHALIVDDSQTVRMVVRRLAEEFGLEMFEAEDGEEGLDRLSAMCVPDLIIVDWKMLRMFGGEFVQIVRSDARYEHTFILMFASEAGVDQIQKALQWGVNDYLTKPCTGKEIREKLESVIRQITAGTAWA